MNQDFGKLKDSLPGEVRGWLTPNGSSVMDGARLAVINAVVLFGLLVLAGLFSLFRALFGWFIPLSTLFFGIAMIGLMTLLFGMIWFRYTTAHREMAFRRGGSNAGRFGLIAASPFIVLALMLFGSGLMALFFGLISFSAGRVGSAMLRMIYAMVFVLLAVGNYLVARVIADR